VTSSNTKPEVAHSRRDIQIVYDIITPPQLARFGLNLGTRFIKGRRFELVKIESE